MAFIANNANPQGGGVPGQARNSMAKYPARGTGIGGGFANTKPRVPPRSRFTPGRPDMTTGQDGIDYPTLREQLRGGLDATGRGFANNGSGAGAVTGGGYQGGGGLDRYGGAHQVRQMRRQMQRQAGDTTNPMPEEFPDTTNPTPAPGGADRAGMGWRASRRDALQSGDLERTDDGFAPTNPGDATGADRAGMDWRAERRAAKRSGAMDVSGADRIGMGYRRDRRQAARAAAGAPPAKPGQPPAM